MMEKDSGAFEKGIRRDVINPDEIQDRLVNETYERHDHGGHEHGHDWDDWLKADRALKSKGNKKKKTYFKSFHEETVK